MVCVLVLSNYVGFNACIKKLFFSFSINDAIDFFMNTEDNSDMETSLDEGDHDFAMIPPTEKKNAEIDIDRDASDDVEDGFVHHLQRRLLYSACDSSFLDKGSKWKSVQCTHLPIKK